MINVVLYLFKNFSDTRASVGLSDVLCAHCSAEVLLLTYTQYSRTVQDG